MKRITADTHHEDIDCPQDVITLTGTPKSMRGQLTLANPVDEAVFVQSLPVQGAEPYLIPSRRGPRLGVRARVPAGETRTQRLAMSLDPHTPPGTYEATVSVGGAERTLRMIVQGKLDVQLDPTHLLLVGVAPGRKHEAVIQLTNRGNVPVEVPRLRHHTALDIDVFCRNLSLAIREKGDEGTQATLDALTRGIHQDLVGWVELTAKEAGQRVPPGEALLLHLTLTLPDDVDAGRTYQGEVRLCNRVLGYTIMPEPAEPKPSPKKSKASTSSSTRKGKTKGD